MALGSLFFRTKMAKYSWTSGRLERSAKMFGESEIALKHCIETLRYDVGTHKNLALIGVAETAAQATQKITGKHAGMMKKQIKAAANQMGANPVSELAEGFRAKALLSGD